MIVDDTYVIAGSPNLHQRSLDGARDTEIAIGCWQPHYLPHDARGDVYHFRMSLWLEHFNKYDPVFESPGSLECLKKVKELSKTNWDAYTAEEDGTETPSHMLPYPFTVKNNGSLVMLQSQDNKGLAERIFGSALVGAGSYYSDIFGHDEHVLTT